MARKKHLINVHTSTGTTAPTGASLYLGEIAVQHTPNDPALWIKVGSAETSTEYEKFIGLTEITNIFNMSHILGSGYTYSGLPHVNSATTIADAYSALTKELIDGELVTAAALNDLNDRVGSLSGLVSEIDIEPLSANVVTNVQNISILSGVVEENELVTAAALNDLNNKINMISANTSGDYITREEFEDHEEVAAAAFNDLNSRIIDLSGDTDEKINNINSQFTTLSGMVLELSGNSGAGAITSVTIDGSGNVVTNATYINSALTITKGIVESGILGSGYTYSGLPYVNSATSIADAYSALTQELIKDELVVSAALNDLNERIPEPVDLEPLSASVVTNQTNIEVISAWVEDNELVTAAALNDLNNRIANVPSSADVENLSAVVFTLSATLEDDELVIAAALNDLNDKVNVISANTSGNFLTVEEYEENEEVIAAALNDLNARIIDLSGDTSDISDSVSNYGQQIQVLSGIVADISGNTGGGGGGGTDTACTEAGHYAPTTSASTKGTTAATTNYIKGIRLDSKNHVIDVVTGAVVTAQTQLSTATTGTGNVVTDINVTGHQITLAKSYSAAPADQFVTLSGATHTLSGAAHNKITALSGATTGINATLTAHTNNGDIHVTAAQKTAWSGKQDAISDLETIRSNAAAGAAKVSNVQADWNTTATTDGSYIKNKPTIPTVPTSNTAFTNDAGYITGYTETDPTVSAWAKAPNKPTYTASEVGALPTGTTLDDVADGTTRKLSNYATTGTVNTLNNTVTAHTANTSIHVTTAQTSAWDGKQDAISDLAEIRSNAASGMAAYNNLNALSAATTAMSVNVGKIAVTGVTVTGTGNAVTNAAYSNSALTLTKGNVQATISDLSTIRNNASSGAAAYTTVTAHTGNTSVHVPSHSSSDSGKVLSVDSNGNLVWITPVSVYTGSQSPAQSLGNDGDIYLQTS